jgi:transposase
MSEKTGSSARQEAVARLLARGVTDRAAAKRVGITDRTIRKWKETAEFRRLVVSCREEFHGRTAAVLGAEGTASVRKLAWLRDQGNDRVALQAAKSIVEMSFKAHELAVLAEQLAELRATVEALKGGEP